MFHRASAKSQDDQVRVVYDTVKESRNYLSAMVVFDVTASAQARAPCVVCVCVCQRH